MTFNTGLLKGIPEQSMDYAKMLLFCIQEDMRMDTPLINKQESVLEKAAKMYWQDTILWEVQDLIDILKENKVIRRDTDYKRKHVRYIIDRPLYVKEVVDDLTDEFINKLRHYFRREYCGVDRGSSPKEVRKHLLIFLEKNDVPVSSLEDIFKRYVDIKLQEQGKQMIANILNFINSSENEQFAGKDLIEFSNNGEGRSDSIFAH